MTVPDLMTAVGWHRPYARGVRPSAPCGWAMAAASVLTVDVEQVEDEIDKTRPHLPIGGVLIRAKDVTPSGRTPQSQVNLPATEGAQHSGDRRTVAGQGQAVACACSVAGGVAWSLPSRSWIRPARIWRCTAIPIWFGRSLGHAR